MSIKSFLESKLNKLDYLDLALIKWSCIVFGVLFVILIPELGKINPWWLVAIVIILAIRPLYRAYFGKINN